MGEARWIHHGLALIGAYAKKCGFNVNLIDLRLLNSWEHTYQTIKDNPSDLYGISISYIDFKAGLRVASIIKEVNPKATVVVGGYAPSNFPEKFTCDPNIDYVVVGEGELTFVDILKNRPQCKVVNGIKPDLDSLPFADRDLFGQYHRESLCQFVPNQPKPMVTMISGRACPFNCGFCQPAERSVFGNKLRRRSPHNVIQELVELYHKYKFKSIMWWDDTFILDKKWVDEFCDIYERYDFKASMVGLGRADIICNNEDMIKRLASVGLNWCAIGFESGSQRLLDFIDKGTTIEQNIKAAEICHKYGIKVFGLFMLGLPTETKSESYATLQMVEKIAPECQAMFYFNPIPSTRLYDYCKVNKLILRPEDEFLEIGRTSETAPRIKGIDYEFLNNLRGITSKDKCAL